MPEEYPLIIRLETKIDELCRDRSITQKIVNSNSSLLALNTAFEEYILLKQDVIIPLGIRYLAISCIASHYQLYQDNREISQLKDIIGQAINMPTHAEVFFAIQVIKSKYCQIYDCDRREFDRIERLTKEMSPTSILSTGKDVGKPIVFTDEEVKDILRKQRAEIFRLLSIMISMLFIGGGIGMSVATRQQPQPISANVPQPSTQPPSPSNSSPAPSLVVAAIPSPSPVPVITPEPQISQDEAISLIQKWLEAKKTLFAPPFNRESAASLMTGKAYTDKIKGVSSNGTKTSASEWLEKNHYYRSYGLQRIDGIEKFEVSGSNAIIDVRMTEHSNLYNAKGQLQKLKSGLYSKIIRYILVKEDETIKISDYNDLKTSKRK
jgi:ARC6-like, IMS domain